MATTKDGGSAVDRFTAPLYGIAEAARCLDVPASTLRTWAHGYGRRRAGGPPVLGYPVLTAIKSGNRRGPRIPFIGLAEGLTLAAFRRGGVPLPRIRPALKGLNQDFAIKHALASKRFFTDGAEVLFDCADQTRDPAVVAAAWQLVVACKGRYVWSEVVQGYLRRVEFGDDGYPTLIHLPAYEVAEVVVDPVRGFGQPIFARGGARLEDALSLFRAGEPLDTVADEYGVPPEQLQDAVRIATHVAA